MSNDSQPAKKPHYTQQYKDRIAELEAQLAAAAAGPAVTVSGSDSTGQVVELKTPLQEIHEGDPLRWITQETDQVGMICEYQRMQGRIVNKRDGMKPGTYENDFKPFKTAHWTACPYKWQGKSDVATRELEWAHREKHHYVIPRDYAERVFSFKENPPPVKAIIAIADYEGLWEHSLLPKGKLTTVTDFDPLRELVRFWLQKYPGKCWINKGMHEDELLVVQELPNPYRAAHYKGAQPINLQLGSHEWSTQERAAL